MVNTARKLIVTLCCAGLTACGGSYVFEEQDSAPSERRDLSSVQDAVPRAEPRSRYGNPASYVVRGKRYQVMDSSSDYAEKGIASWYGTKFHGRRTSSGEPYDMYAMTAAHKSLPLPTYVEVTNLKNNRRVIVKVNDRGPFHENRIIDLSYAAAYRLGILGKGTGFVEVRAINPGEPAAVSRVARTAPAPAPESPAGKINNMYLQVGAFISRDNAERLHARLLEAALGNTRVSETQHNGNTVYRVRLGPVPDVETADELVGKLAALGIHNSRVVTD